MVNDIAALGYSTGLLLMPQHAIVSVSHEVKYPDPIEVTTGDRLTLTGEVDIWDGHRWLWALAPDGKAGWIPDTLVVEDDNAPVARTNYSAQELPCTAGERIEILRSDHGWAWCRNAAQVEGWVPQRNLTGH